MICLKALSIPLRCQSSSALEMKLWMEMPSPLVSTAENLIERKLKGCLAVQYNAVWYCVVAGVQSQLFKCGKSGTRQLHGQSIYRDSSSCYGTVRTSTPKEYRSILSLERLQQCRELFSTGKRSRQARQTTRLRLYTSSLYIFSRLC